MCRSNIKDDYFEYNELFKNFESKKIESVINSLRQPFADIAKNLDIKRILNGLFVPIWRQR